jgi:hypothetical protein
MTMRKKMDNFERAGATRAAIYARLSVDRERSGGSIPEQLRVCRTMADR